MMIIFFELHEQQRQRSNSSQRTASTYVFFSVVEATTSSRSNAWISNVSESAEAAIGRVAEANGRVAEENGRVAGANGSVAEANGRVAAANACVASVGYALLNRAPYAWAASVLRSPYLRLVVRPADNPARWLAEEPASRLAEDPACLPVRHLAMHFVHHPARQPSGLRRSQRSGLSRSGHHPYVLWRLRRALWRHTRRRRSPWGERQRDPPPTPRLARCHRCRISRVGGRRSRCASGCARAGRPLARAWKRQGVCVKSHHPRKSNPNSYPRFSAHATVSVNETTSTSRTMISA